MPLLPPWEVPSRSPQSRQLQNQISTQPLSPERALPLWQEETEHSASVALVSASVALVSDGLSQELKKPPYGTLPFCKPLER